MSSYQISQNHNFQTVLWAVAGGVYHGGCAVRRAARLAWSQRWVAGSAIAIPLVVVAAISYILLLAAIHLVAQTVRLAWMYRSQIGYAAWVGAKVLALTGLCVANFVLVSMIPLTFWAGVAISAILAYVGYSAASK